jgi:hypothetical protein
MLALFHTHGLGIVVLHVMVPPPYGYFTILVFYFKWVKEGNAAI